MEKTTRLEIMRYSADTPSALADEVVRERALTIILNGEELVTLLCSPGEFNHLAAGYLASESIIATAADIVALEVDEERGIARLETTTGQALSGRPFQRVISSGCGRGAALYSAADVSSLAPVKATLAIAPAQVYELMRQFQHQSELFRDTGGVHSAAIAGPEGVLYFAEDIGRHNAVDRLFGRALLEKLDISGRLLLSSGRISSEIVSKAARRDIPLIISKSAPTDTGVALADRLNMTVVGFVRGQRMNVYCHPERIIIRV